MKSAKASKNLIEIPYPPQKRAFKKKRKVLHQQKQMPRFHKLLQNA